jgi:PAS domain S-box-containing protein
MTAAALITAAMIAFLIWRARPLAAAATSSEPRRILAEHVVDLVSTHSAQGDFRYVSPVLAALMGEYPGSLLGKNPADYAHPDDVNALEGLWKRALVWTAAPASTTWRLRKHDGDYAWLETTARAANADVRDIAAIVCASRDITERKQIEDALRESEQRFRSTLETVRLVAVGLDIQGTVTFCNDSLVSLTGWTRAELIGENWFDKCVPAGDRSRAVFYDHISRGDLPSTDESEILCRDHTRRTIAWDHTVLRTALGDILGTASLGADVTETRREETALKLLHSISLSISSARDLDEALERTIESLCAATGWTYGEAWMPTGDGHHIERTTYHLASRMSCQPFIDAGRDKAKVMGEGLTGRAWQSKSIEWIQDLTAVRADEFPRLVTAAQCGFKSAVAVPVVADSGVVAVLSFFMDRARAIDERHTQMIFVVANQVGTIIERRLAQRQYEAEILRARDEAEAASSAKSDFLSRMSHELRTPLNSVIGFANVLRKNKSGRLSSDDVAFLDRITANGRHLLTLVNNVLDIAKVEAGRLTVTSGIVAVDELVRSVAEQLEGQPRDSGVQLRVDAPDDMVPIDTDGVLLKQVLINLVSNALRFTHEGGVVIAVDDGGTGRPLRIDVRDTGIGIEHERQAAIFEPFEQADDATHRKYGGTGLGLSIAKAICDALDFDITLESEPGKGSTFSVHLTGGRTRHRTVSDSDRNVPESDKAVLPVAQSKPAQTQKR